ncbi:MAG: hypothetical protein WDM89_12185 [Rhizomicrobium sp.]
MHKDITGASYADPGEMAARVATAAQETGIGLTLLPVFYAHSGFGGHAPKPSQRRFIHDIDGFAKLLDSSRKAVAVLDDRDRWRGAAFAARGDARTIETDHGACERRPVHIHIA